VGDFRPPPPPAAAFCFDRLAFYGTVLLLLPFSPVEIFLLLLLMDRGAPAGGERGVAAAAHSPIRGGKPHFGARPPASVRKWGLRTSSTTRGDSDGSEVIDDSIDRSIESIDSIESIHTHTH
jgi:hypothetical protein